MADDDVGKVGRIEVVVDHDLGCRGFDQRLLEQSERIVITCHLTPDGDAMGSSLGLWHVLTAIGKQATVVSPDMVPKSLARARGTMWMRGLAAISVR